MTNSTCPPVVAAASAAWNTTIPAASATTGWVTRQWPLSPASAVGGPNWEVAPPALANFASCRDLMAAHASSALAARTSKTRLKDCMADRWYGHDSS
ncbi:MAG: hypothetical protein QOG64_919 [Acidimicrobiaceae bacterium]|nr:hypothetical protein [Acidimicrobiaceae bacterium]